MALTPPIHITGNPNLDWIVFAAGFLVVLYWLRALRLAREGARRFLSDLVRSVVVYFISSIVLTASGRVDRSRVQGLSICIAFFAFVVFQSRKRSRRISTSTRRAIIERDLPGGEYDSQRHHIDHIWPHARGGSNTADNLRVIEKKRNLQRGAKRPRIRDMF
jgi:5-methylcytosine-specific restriction endonuclease McrA